jgi:hypothetical protein
MRPRGVIVNTTALLAGNPAQLFKPGSDSRAGHFPVTSISSNYSNFETDYDARQNRVILNGVKHTRDHVYFD